MRKRIFFIIRLIALVCVAAISTYAGPPFLTDDPQPVDFQHWEFYFATMHTLTSDGWSGTAPHVEVNYGVFTNVQLHLIAPLAYDAPQGDVSHYGYGDTELGFKLRFIQETDRRPQVGVFPLLEVPTGNQDHGLGTGHLHAFLPIWAQKSWGTWTAYGGGGYGINPGTDNRDWGYVGALLQKQVVTNLIIGAEVYHQTSMTVGDPGNTAFNLGAVFDFNEQHHLLFSAGRSIDGPVRFQCYLAYQFTFDNSFFHFWNKRHD
jgi:hypothetical protein